MSSAKTNNAATAMMFYMSAQNELAPLALDDIAEIASNAPVDNVAFHIMLDTIETGGSRKGRVTYDRSIPPGATKESFAMTGKAPDLNAVDVRVFNRFLREAEQDFDNYETKQKILVLWGHGGGMVMLDQEPETGEKRTQASVVDFARALERRARSPSDPLRFDIIAFDSCYMSVIETMHQFRGIADYTLVASTVVDASGYPYQPIVKELKVNGSKLGPRLAAQMICKIYNDHYEALGKRKRRYLYACDTAKIGACAGALNKLGKDLSELLKDDPADGPVRKALATTLFSAHETASYVGILIFLKELLFSFEGAADARALSALRASSAGLKARVEDAFHGPLGDSGSIPTSPLIWSPVNVHEFNNNVAIYSRLDASSGGDGGWLSMWYVFHGLTPVPHAAGLRSAFEHGLRPGR